jgi:hypothetical protein
MIHQSKNLAELLVRRRLSLVQREGMCFAFPFYKPPSSPFKSLVGFLLLLLLLLCNMHPTKSECVYDYFLHII